MENNNSIFFEIAVWLINLGESISPAAASFITGFFPVFTLFTIFGLPLGMAALKAYRRYKIKKYGEIKAESSDDADKSDKSDKKKRLIIKVIIVSAWIFMFLVSFSFVSQQ